LPKTRRQVFSGVSDKEESLVFKIPFFLARSDLLQRLITAVYLHMPFLLSKLLPGLITPQVSLVCLTLLGNRVSESRRSSCLD
jgi:hypothetical protein